MTRSKGSITALALFVAGCNSAIAPGLRPVEPHGTGGRVDATWAAEQLRDAAISLHHTLVEQGANGHLALRLRPEETQQLFTQNSRERAGGVQLGAASSDGEPRWTHLRTLGPSPLVGFCARGVRIAEPNGPEGLSVRALFVERLLVVGAERDGLWGMWLEGLLLTEGGWRMAPGVPFAQQVEDPRREHADVQLWDCDVGQRPLRDRPLATTRSSE
jgi:hypothetical protein